MGAYAITNPRFSNPFVQGVDDDSWDGEACPLNRLYIDGDDMTQYFSHWDFTLPDGTEVKLDSPHEFCHTLSTVLNTLTREGFTFLGLWEGMRHDENSGPGS